MTRIGITICGGCGRQRWAGVGPCGLCDYPAPGQPAILGIELEIGGYDIELPTGETRRDVPRSEIKDMCMRNGWGFRVVAGRQV